MSIESYQTKAGVRYRIRYRDLSHKQRTISDLPTKKAALAEEAKIRAAVEQRTLINPSAGRVSIETLGERFLQIHAVKPATMARYESAWNVHVKPRWGSAPVRNVRTSDIRAWIQEQKDADVSASTIGSGLDVLSGILALAVSDHLIARNPVEGVKRPTVQRKRRSSLTHAQVDTLANAAGATYAPYGIVVRTLAYTGLRFGELSALRVSDFDRLRRRLRVLDGATEVKGHRVLGTTKADRGRSVPVPALLLPLLEEQTRGKLPEAWLFVGPQGAPLSVQRFRSRIWSKALAAVQTADPTFPTVTPHDMRRTAITLAVSAGANIKGLQTMAGHSRSTTTLDVYADEIPDDLDAVAERMHAAYLVALSEQTS